MMTMMIQTMALMILGESRLQRTPSTDGSQNQYNKMEAAAAAMWMVR